MKMKKILASVVAFAMAITMMPNLSMTVHAGEPCVSCGHSEGSHDGLNGECGASSLSEGIMVQCECTSYQAPTTHQHNWGNWEANGMGHWKVCNGDGQCDNSSLYTGLHDNAGANGGCSICGYGTIHDHTSSCYVNNGNGTHSTNCGKGTAVTNEGHSGGTATCQSKKVCIVCTAEYGQKAGHNWGDWNASTGKRSCQTSGCSAEDTCDHDGATTGTCETCSMNLGSGQQGGGTNITFQKDGLVYSTSGTWAYFNATNTIGDPLNSCNGSSNCINIFNNTTVGTYMTHCNRIYAICKANSNTPSEHAGTQTGETCTYCGQTLSNGQQQTPTAPTLTCTNPAHQVHIYVQEISGDRFTFFGYAGGEPEFRDASVTNNSVMFPTGIHANTWYFLNESIQKYEVCTGLAPAPVVEESKPAPVVESTPIVFKNDVIANAPIETKNANMDKDYVYMNDFMQWSSNVTDISGNNVKTILKAEDAEKFINSIAYLDTGIAYTSPTHMIYKTNTWISFTKNTIKEMEESGYGFTIVFNYDHKKYQVEIPEGAKLSELTEEADYVGFLYLMKLFGGKVIE